MNLKNKLNLVSNNRNQLNKIQKMTLDNYKQLLNHHSGDESHITPSALKHINTFLNRMILKYNLQ